MSTDRTTYKSTVPDPSSFFAAKTCETCRPPTPTEYMPIIANSTPGACKCRNLPDEGAFNGYLHSVAAQPLPLEPFLSPDGQSIIWLHPQDQCTGAASKRLDARVLSRFCLAETGHYYRPTVVDYIANLQPNHPDASYVEKSKSIVEQMTGYALSIPPGLEHDSTQHDRFSESDVRHLAALIEDGPETASCKSYRKKLKELSATNQDDFLVMSEAIKTADFDPKDFGLRVP